MADQSDRPTTRADLDRAVESIAHEISRRAEESATQFKSLSQSLELIGAAVQGIQTSVAMHTRVLTQRGEDRAADRNEVSRLRADLDAAIARIAALEQARPTQ